MSVVSLLFGPSKCSWSSVIPSRASMVKIMVFPSQQKQSNPYRIDTIQANDDDDALFGVAAVGCSDGSIYLLSLENGNKVFPGMILGAPVCYISHTIIQDASNVYDFQKYILVAACVDGEIYVWEIKTIVIEMHDIKIERFSDVQLLFKTNIRPAISSLKHAGFTTGIQIIIDSTINCYKIVQLR
jgi:hypothetical protein